MSRRLVTIILAIAAFVSSFILGFSIATSSALWSIISAILLVALIIGYCLCSRCPHCGRVMDCTLFRSTIHCRYCGELVDLDERL